jgi:BON domain
MRNKKLPAVLKATVVGAVAMYIYDPVLGRSRRALARDKGVRLRKAIREAARTTMRDLKNRIWGTLAEGRAAFLGHTVDDAVLKERVRSKLGFIVRNPSSIEVEVNNGRVSLDGPVLSDEVQQLIGTVRSIRGVREVNNFLTVHQNGDGIPGLQGDIPKPEGQVLDIFQHRWSPSTRFLLGTSGVVLFLKFNPFGRNVFNLSILTALGLLACSILEEERKQRTSSEARVSEFFEIAG